MFVSWNSFIVIVDRQCWKLVCWKAIYHSVVIHSQSGTPLSKLLLSGNEYVGTGGGKLISIFNFFIRIFLTL